MKLVFATLLIVSMVLSSTFLQMAMADQKGFCDSKCAVRCSEAGKQERCLKYCNLCCKRCNCVPSGTYGNKSECPCYRDMVDPKGKPKCP